MSDRPRTSLLLQIAYDGSRFFGVAPQPGRRTVAGALDQRLLRAFGQAPRRLVIASRTDAGVHAQQNLATCWFPAELDVEAARPALLGDEEGGLRVLDARRVPMQVFARGLAQRKTYRYRLEGGHDPAFLEALRAEDLAGRADPERPRLPPEHGRVGQVALPLDVEAMRQAAAHLLGEQDFRAFAIGLRPGPSPRLRIEAIEIHALDRQGWPHLVLDLTAPAFLRKMVRIVVGTLAEVGAGLRSPDQIPALLARGDRQATGAAALARGLTLLHRAGLDLAPPAPEPSVLPEPPPPPTPSS